MSFSPYIPPPHVPLPLPPPLPARVYTRAAHRTETSRLPKFSEHSYPLPFSLDDLDEIARIIDVRGASYILVALLYYDELCGGFRDRVRPLKNLAIEYMTRTGHTPTTGGAIARRVAALTSASQLDITLSACGEAIVLIANLPPHLQRFSADLERVIEKGGWRAKVAVQAFEDQARPPNDDGEFERDF